MNVFAVPLCLLGDVHINLPGIVSHVLDAHIVDHDDDNVGCFGLLRLRLRRLLGEREAGMCRKEEEGEGEENEEERNEGPVVVLVLDMVAAVIEAGHGLCLDLCECCMCTW